MRFLYDRAPHLSLPIDPTQLELENTETRLPNIKPAIDNRIQAVIHVQLPSGRGCTLTAHPANHPNLNPIVFTALHCKVPSLELLVKNLPRILVLPTMAGVGDNITLVNIILVTTRDNHARGNWFAVGTHAGRKIIDAGLRLTVQPNHAQLHPIKEHITNANTRNRTNNSLVAIQPQTTAPHHGRGSQIAARLAGVHPPLFLHRRQHAQRVIHHPSSPDNVPEVPLLRPAKIRHPNQLLTPPPRSGCGHHRRRLLLFRNGHNCPRIRVRNGVLWGLLQPWVRIGFGFDMLRVFGKRVGKSVVSELLQAIGDGVGNGIILGVGERGVEKLGDSVELREQVVVWFVGGSVAYEIEVEVERPI
ncbi:hypothetical protein V8G54_017819 [Vigna mungo]|uniref:Uncharacterized protein n=1 Tax=Vigna mungo TaxID=3915 RepID=A0AAQ3NMX6_VIGMU